MSDAQNEEELSDISKKPSTEALKYHYSPVSSNCMACAARATSRKHIELEAQRSDIICGPFPSTEDIRYLPETLAKQKYHRSQLHVVTTNHRVKVFGEWTEQKLLDVVTDRLLQRATSLATKPYKKIPIKPLSIGVPYDPIIHRGIYNECILRQLYCSGASESVVIRAMKFGLRYLKPEELNYFVQFGVSIPVLRSRQLWKELIDESLVTSLGTMGFDEKSSRKIVLTGMLAQNEICLMQLMLAGVDVPGILNWQGPVIEVGTRMVQFLRKLGVLEDVLQLVVQKGVDEETKEMLKDLGYTETEEEEHPGMHEVVVCECDLTILESEVSSVDSHNCDDHSSKVLASKLEGICSCFPGRSSSSKSSDASLVTCRDMKSVQDSLTDPELLVDRNDYLRQTVMVPLAWAMAKALEYRPSDPKHYIACQLVRWRYGGVCKTEMKETEEFVMARSIEMDKKLMEQKRKNEEELVAKRDAEILENIPCHPCWEREQIHRVKERCWKCIKKWVPNYEPCELQEICSSCKVDFSDILNFDSSTNSIGDISRVREVEKGVSKDRESFASTYQHSYIENEELPSSQRDYNMCEESFHSDFNHTSESGGRASEA